MATLLVMGFSQAPRALSEWHAAQKTKAQIRAGCLQQWDILEVRPDHAEPGRLEGRRAQDEHHVNAGQGRYLFFNVCVPSISIGCKGLIERPAQEWPACGREIASRRDAAREEQLPADEIRRGFYVDYSALPPAAQMSLLVEGTCTLAEVDARRAVGHKLHPELVGRLFTEFVCG